MIKTITAYTMELDDPKAALAELLDQIKPETALLKNSLGIIACHVEFTDPEIIRGIQKALPFPVIGIATTVAAVTDHTEEMIFSIAVFTSDDVFFSPGLSAPLNQGLGKELEVLYTGIAEKSGTKAVMMLTMTPPLLHLSGDDIVEELDRVSEGLPNFGSVSLNYADRFKDSEIIYEGECYTDRILIALIAGNFTPSFSIYSIPKERIIKRNAIVTKSVQNRVMEINGAPVAVFMENLGFSQSKGTEGLGAIPIVVRFADGSSAVRSILEVSPEGYLVFGGRVPEGCTISVGPISPDDVMQTAKAAAQSGGENCQGLLMFSCFARCLALQLDTMAEMEHIRGSLKTRGLPFLAIYSGGEICPVPNASGKLVNRLHNVSLVSCGLE